MKCFLTFMVNLANLVEILNIEKLHFTNTKFISENRGLYLPQSEVSPFVIKMLL